MRAATVHDFFNIIAVLVLLPIELTFNFIEKSASYFTTVLYGSVEGVKYSSPIKAAIKPPVYHFLKLHLSPISPDFAAILMILAAGVIIIFLTDNDCKKYEILY